MLIWCPGGAAQIKAGPRVRRPSKIIYVHYGLQT